MEFNAPNVERVVKEFYLHGATRSGGADPGSHDWLIRAQASPQAWNFAWELLTPEKSAEVQFFGANALVLKVTRHFHEVNDADFPLLQNRLVQLFRSYSSGGPKVVLVRLSVAVASLMIHSMPRLWADPVRDQIALLRKDLDESGTKMLYGFLELLTVLPEEFSTQVMPAERRNVVKEKLLQNLPEVLQLIVQLLQAPSVPQDCVRQSVRSLQGWVQFGIPMEATEKILELILPKVADEDLAEVYLDVITSIVSHPDTYEHPEAMKRIISKLVTLEQLLSKYFLEENYEAALPLASLFIAVGETHSRLLLDWTVQSEEGKATATKLISLILQTSSCPAQYPTHERLSEMAFGFWYIFQDDIIACDPPQYQSCVSVYGQAYHALVEAMLKKSMLPLSYDGWSSDEKEAFRCYRTDVGDTIMYCYNILKDDLLKLLNHHLDEGMRLCQQGQKQNWPYMETCLYAWSAIGASLVEEEENYLVIQFLAKLPSIPCKEEVSVISSTLDCIGGFAEWLDGYPNLVANLVPVVTSAIGDPKLAMCATMALKDLARDCTEALQPCSRDIISACAAALSSGQLKPGECARLMFPIGRMVAYLPRGDMLNQLQNILTPYLTDLQNITNRQQSGPSAPDRGQILYVLKIVTTLFQSLDGSGPMTTSKQKEHSQQGQQKESIAILLPQIFPLVTNVAKSWFGDEEVMDLAYSFVKQALVCLQGTKILVMESVEFVLTSYTHHPHYCAFDVTSQLLLQYANDPSLRYITIIKNYDLLSLY